MSCIVIYDDHQNATRYRPFDAVQDAATHLEHLANNEGITSARLYMLAEVQFEVKSYVRVEIGGAEATAAAATAPTAAATPAPAPAAAAAASPQPALAAEPEPAPVVRAVEVEYTEVSSPVDDILDDVAYVEAVSPTEAEPARAAIDGRRGLFGR